MPNIMEEWIAAQLLSTNQRDDYFESALIDIILSKAKLSEISSLLDCKRAVEAFLKTVSTFENTAREELCLNRVTNKLWHYLHAKEAATDVELTKILKSLSKTLKIEQSLVELYYKDDKPNLVLTFPDLAQNEDNNKIIAALTGFACRLHGTPVDNVSFIRDLKLGSGELVLPTTFKKLILEFTSSAESPTGLFKGDTHVFSSGFKGNSVEVLAAMRLLNIKQEFVRKRKYSKDSKKVTTAFNTLQEAFNKNCGLNWGPDVASFVVKFIKAVFISCIKVHNKYFPGGWIHSSRVSNSCKSDEAMLATLGWRVKAPSNHKIMEVLFNTVDPDDKSNGKFKLVNITKDKRQFTYQEFRTAVCLSLPKLDTQKPDSMEKDLVVGTLDFKNSNILKTFASPKMSTVVDALEQSFNFKVSIKDPKSKTKEIHYRNSRNALLNSTSSVPLIDANGTSYDKFSSLPEKTQKFLREKYRFTSKRSRPIEENAVASSSSAPMEVDSSAQPPSKKKRMTKGQAAEATRKSGRLAKQAKKTTT
jgi:hypothetical protein